MHIYYKLYDEKYSGISVSGKRNNNINIRMKRSIIQHFSSRGIKSVVPSGLKNRRYAANTKTIRMKFNFSAKNMLGSFLVAGSFLSQTPVVQAQQQAPAYPLISVDPYFSIWSSTDVLYGSSTHHWTGKDNSLQGIIRVDGKAYYFLGAPITETSTVLPLVDKTGAWKYVTATPAGQWTAPGFDDASWQQATGAFSDGDDAPNKWTSHDIYTRRVFNLDNTNFDHLLLNLHHDDNVVVYINGVLAYKAKGWTSAPAPVEILPAAKAALKKGQNVLAIHCANTAGGAYLDAGLVEKKTPALRLETAKQQSVAISATQTVYRFDCGQVGLKLTFTAPLLPDDLDLLSRPADYISFSVSPLDGKSHNVQLYFSAAGDIAVNTPDEAITWQRSTESGLEVMRTGTVAQNILGRSGDDVRIDWGYLYLVAPQTKGLTTVMTSSQHSVNTFANSGTLSIKDDAIQPRAAGTNPLTLAASYDLGRISSTTDRHLILAYDDIHSIEYFHQPLNAWWKRNGQSTAQMLKSAAADYAQIIKKCNTFDQRLDAEALAAGGTSYAKLCELAYRQAFAASKLVADPQGNPLLFTKENFSNGDMGTVDVIYPTFPLPLYYNSKLAEAILNPIFYYCESGHWTRPYSPHDMGTYPIANGRTEEEGMPVEESGNMLAMVAALARAEGNASYAEKHWSVLSRWAGYLLENGMDPENQLTTDDFAGPSAHNANLSAKAIMGIACYGKLAEMLGKKDLAKEYTDTARKMAAQWMTRAKEGDHYKLTFDRPGTWSLKYNLVWDKILDLHIFPKSVMQDEIAFYLTKQNKYGVPLDSRATYTKSDWINWTATIADDKATFEKFIDPLYRYVTETPDRIPLSDWHETISGKHAGFQARSVVGGYFMKLLADKFAKEKK